MNGNPTLVTAAEAGISESEQVKIALELILSQGGIALMQQIYEAVEARLGPGFRLSKQGKDSLRRVVNKRAVEDGYIHAYDRNHPGWQITEEGVNFIRQELGRPVDSVKSTARALVTFRLALKEARALLDFHDEARHNANQNNRNLEVFKRAGIILIVTAWETFIEDILELYVNQKLDNASSPSEMQKAFNAVAQIWYVAILNKQDGHPKPNDFVNWTGENWKQLIRDKLQEDLSTLNTPKSKNVGDLSKRYVGVDITDSWSWRGMSGQRACRKLDRLIELRGELAHRLVNYFEARSSIRRDRLINDIDFIERLAARTEEAILKLS
jgi:hypothetical protein